MICGYQHNTNHDNGMSRLQVHDYQLAIRQGGGDEKNDDLIVTMIRLRKRKTRIAVDNLEIRAIPWSGRHLSVRRPPVHYVGHVTVMETSAVRFR